MSNNKLIFLMASLSVFAVSSYAQVPIINGPSCVRLGTEYHYTIESPQDSIGVQVCVNGGTMLDSPDTCLSPFTGSVIRIIWTNQGLGQISVLNSSGTKTLLVSFAADLEPGQLDSTTSEITVDQGAIPDTIRCTPASFGSCAPEYQYQWQWSIDKVNWEQVEAATSESLKVSDPVMQPTYFRRMVTELSSATTKYSSISSVYINPIAN